MIKDLTSAIPSPLLTGDRIRRASEISDILKAVVAGKVREIAIAREVGDSVLYHSLFESARNGFCALWSVRRVFNHVKRSV
jgi:hypothetical protein